MSETQTPDPDKARKTRSFGSFMLFFLILIVVLAMLAGDTIKPINTLSQDQYLWHLYNGRVVDQQFRGAGGSSNVVEGTYTPFKPGTDGPTAKFETKFTSLQPHEDEFRQAKAIDLRTVRPSEFLTLVNAGLYQPVGARSVTAVERLVREDANADDDTKRSGESAPARKPVLNQTEERSLLLVEVLASGEGAWSGGLGELRSSSARTYLPKEPQHQWVRIDVGKEASLDGLYAALAAADVSTERIFLDITKDKGSTWKTTNNLWSTVLLYYLPWILVFFIIMFFMRQMRSQGGAGGVMSFGRSRAQLYSKENRTNVTFDDVAGAVEAKDEVKEIVEFLKNPSRFTRIGGRIPRGVLLVGPPGCGKTLLAKAIAGEAEVPFFSISGSDFVEMFVGVGASRVRDLFKQARDNSPCIIFLDEIDAVGRRRGSGMGGGHDEREQTLNAILVEMDGFSTDEGIIVVAATNRPDVLDPALLRPGRFDREVTIDLPDLEGREAILGVHLKKVKTGDAVDVKVLARSTPGYSGADLAAIVNEAAIMAVLAKRDSINMEDLEESRDKVRYGRQKKTSHIEEDDRKITAYHEAGHAVVASVLPETDPPHKVTIIPRGRALGTTMVLPEKESYHMQKKRLEAQLAMLFGGRIAEAEFCGDISAGASDDIRRATDLARAMVTELGMSQAIGPINYAERQGNDFLGTELGRGKLHSEETAREIDREVQSVLNEAYARAEEIVRANRDAIETMTAALLRYETVSGAEIRRLLKGVSLDDLRPDPDPPATPEPPSARTDGNGERRGSSLDQPGELPGNPGLSPA